MQPCIGNQYFDMIAIHRAPTVREKPGKSGNSEITLPALESQGIPHVLFKIREKSVNSVSSRQHQNNIRPRPDFRAAHLFPRSNGPFSSFLRAYFARCLFDGSSLRTVFTGHQFFQTHYGTSVILSWRVRLRDSVNHNCEAKNLVFISKLFEPKHDKMWHTRPTLHTLCHVPLTRR